MLIRVVKVGGSLLDWSLLPPALQAWEADQPQGLNVLIVGGGALADAIRQADRLFNLGAEAAHWLCVDAMSITAPLLHAILPDSELITTYSALQTRLGV